MATQRKSSGTQRRSNTNRTLPYSPQITLLTAGERRFYHDGLKPAIDRRYLVSFKVRLADVITVENWSSRYGRKIAQKHLDFVLLTPKATRIVAAIELNDATHDSTYRQRRDDFMRLALDSAQVPFVVFPIYQSYDPKKIRSRILNAVDKNRRARGSSNGK